MNYTPQDFGDLSSPASLERMGKWGEKVAALPREIRRGRLIREAGVDWKSLPGWKGLKDVDKVYFNPNIDDQTLWCPRVDLFEEDTGHLLVEVELPGVPREDIGLELDEDDEDGSMSLTIAALKPQRAKEESGGVSHPGETLRPLLSDRAAALQGRTRPHPGAHQRRGAARAPDDEDLESADPHRRARGRGGHLRLRQGQGEGRAGQVVVVVAVGVLCSLLLGAHQTHAQRKKEKRKRKRKRKLFSSEVECTLLRDWSA